MWGSNGKARLLVFRSHAATLCSYVTSWKNRSKTTFVPLSKRYTASLLTYRVKRSYRLFISTSANVFIFSNNHNLSLRQLTKAAISLISANNFTCYEKSLQNAMLLPYAPLLFSWLLIKVSLVETYSTIHVDTQNTMTAEVLILRESPDCNSICLSFHFQKHRPRSFYLGE